jgi:hypothetical protein
MFHSFMSVINLSMSIQILKVNLGSSRPTFDNIYFKLSTSEVFVSRVTQEDKILEEVELCLESTNCVEFEIWSYEPMRIMRSWSIDLAALKIGNRKYKLKEGQWTIRLELSGH